MVIIEGPDGSGKTTLANYLCGAAQLPKRPRHVNSDTTPKGSQLKYLSDEQRPWPVVTGLYDRYPLVGEMVYGPVLRGYLNEEFTHNEQAFLHLISEFWEAHPLIVFCLPSWEVIAENLGKTMQPRQIMRASNQTRKGIYAAYLAMYYTLRANKRNVYRYDYTTQSATVILSAVREQIAMYGRGHEFVGRPRVQEVQ